MKLQCIIYTNTSLMYLNIYQTYQEILFIRESVFEHERKKTLKLRNSAFNEMVNRENTRKIFSIENKD